MMAVANIVGIVGVILLLLAYFLLQNNQLNPYRLTYPTLNLLGSSMILFSLFFAWNLSAALVEFAWALISLYGILKNTARRQSDKK